MHTTKRAQSNFNAGNARLEDYDFSDSNLLEKKMLRAEKELEELNRQEYYKSLEKRIGDKASKLAQKHGGWSRLGEMKIPVSGWVYNEDRSLLFLTTPLTYPNGEKIIVFVNGYRIDPNAKLDGTGYLAIKFDGKGNRIFRSPYEIPFLNRITEKKKEGNGEVFVTMNPNITLNKSMLDEEGRLREGWQSLPGYPFTLSIYKNRNFPHSAPE
ncbi:MAG: hypothetical protein ACP5SJ_03135 [Candidatus Micrarchaeia archaeon]